jgi:short-subunit dehydrogenase
MQNFNGKHIWLIGVSSGIGRALARELAGRGAILALSARRAEELHALNTELGGGHEIFPLDIGDGDAVAKTARDVFEKFQKLDAAVNLAALYSPTAVADMTLTAAAQMVQVNLMGTLALTHALIPHMRAQGHGLIALCGSVAGYRGLPNAQPYGATKAAVINFVESLRTEEAKHNITIKLINPGFVRTPLTDKNTFKMPMIIEPEEAATSLANGLLGAGFEIHFPKKFTYVMKILAALPYPLFFSLARKMVKP